MRVLFCCIFLFASTLLSAQSQRAIVGFVPEAKTGRDWQSEVLAVPLEATPFLSYFLIWSGDAASFQIRFSANGRNWTAWQAVAPDDHAEQRAGKTISHLGMTDKAHHFFQIKATASPGQVECHFYNPGDSQAIVPEPQSDALESRSCPCPLPANLTRVQWCPAGNCPPDPDPTLTTTTHLIVHHSAGTNTSNDWAAVVRSIWNFHVNGNGWADIGYNWLIDPNGVIYIGRGDGILGAHFCAQNTATTGVCMLGDFTAITPTAAAISSLQSLLAWKACDVGADPLGAGFHPPSGLNLQYISGHRDGCNTACPGDAFYPLLPTIRQGVADHINTGCEATANDEQLTADKVRLSPNPTSDRLEITLQNELTGALEARLYDAYGRILLQRSFEKTTPSLGFDLDLSAFPAGSYWLRLDMDHRNGGFWVVKM